jgi:hypothetical protein
MKNKKEKKAACKLGSVLGRWHTEEYDNILMAPFQGS